MLVRETVRKSQNLPLSGGGEEGGGGEWYHVEMSEILVGTFESFIYTLNCAGEHPRSFHMGVPPSPTPPGNILRT